MYERTLCSRRVEMHDRTNWINWWNCWRQTVSTLIHLSSCHLGSARSLGDSNDSVIATYWRMLCFCCLINGTDITRSSDVQSAYKLVAAHTVGSDWQFNNVSSNRTAQPCCLNFSICITVSCTESVNVRQYILTAAHAVSEILQCYRPTVL